MSKTFGEVRWSSGLALVSADIDAKLHPMFGVKAHPHVAIKIKRMFPRAKQNRTGAVYLDDTPEVARDLEWLLERYPMESDADTLTRIKERADEHRVREETVHAILTGARPHLEFREPARPARDYQLTAADLMRETGRLLLADELGLGKTMSALLLLRDPETLPALVVCPTHLPEQWVEELRKTLPWLIPHIVNRLAPYDPSLHRSMNGCTPDVLVMGYSKLRGWGDHLAGAVRTVIFDEAQELRKSESQKWTAAAQIADKADFKVGLTATPVYNYAGEIHTIMQVIAPGALGSREEFVREWAGGGKSTFGDNVHVGDPAVLGNYLRAEGLMLRRTRVEVGRELPEVVRVPHWVDTDVEIYDELVDQAVVDLAELIVSRPAGMNQEIFHAHGELDWRLRQATGIAKAPYVAEFVKLLLESDEKVVLFGWHRAVYEIWQDKLESWSPVFYTGTESPKQKRDARDAFVGGDSPLLIMSLRSGAGLDGLQEVAHIATFGELDWSPGMHEQCIGRLHRDGQDAPVVAYFLVSDHGADPLMAEVLQLKRQQSEPLVDPDKPLLQPVVDQSARVRELAKAVLAKRKGQG